MVVPPASVQVPNQRSLAPNVTSVSLTANDIGDIDMIPGTVHRSPGIYLTTEENPAKPQLVERMMKAIRPVITSNGASFLLTRSTTSYSMSGGENDGKERMG